MKKVRTTSIASPPTGRGAVGKAWDAVSVSFDRFCLTAGTSASTALRKADELLMAMALHVAADDGAVEHVARHVRVA